MSNNDRAESSQRVLHGPGTRVATIAVPVSVLGIMFALMADSERLALRIATSGAAVALMGILADSVFLALIDFATQTDEENVSKGTQDQNAWKRVKHALKWLIVGLGALGALVLFAYITLIIATELAEVAL